MAPYGLVAMDGADDDGGTLYALIDGGRPILTAAWPQPLEKYAADRGRPVVRLPAYAGVLDDRTTTTPRRHPVPDMMDDLNPTTRIPYREDESDLAGGPLDAHAEQIAYQEQPTFAQIVQALTDTRALIGELERHIEEERENLALMLDELEPFAKGA